MPVRLREAAVTSIHSPAVANHLPAGEKLGNVYEVWYTATYFDNAIFHLQAFAPEDDLIEYIPQSRQRGNTHCVEDLISDPATAPAGRVAELGNASRKFFLFHRDDDVCTRTPHIIGARIMRSPIHWGRPLLPKSVDDLATAVVCGPTPEPEDE